MGKLVYGPQDYEIEIDDRALAHVKIVLLSKLRRGESFSFSWTSAHEEGSGRHTIWLHPSIPLRFDFYGGRAPSLNRQWIKVLTDAANGGDFHIADEPQGGEEGGSRGRW